MASSQDMVDHITEQMAGAGHISARKMFGEYGIYCDDKLIGLICNNMLYLKLTTLGKLFAPELKEAPPYKGARPSLVVSDTYLEDSERLVQLVRKTLAAVPRAAPKKSSV
jgi:DNA transformation protein and related proteins